MTTRSARLLLPVLAAGLVLTGCTKGEEKPASPPASSSAAATGSEPTDTSTGSTDGGTESPTTDGASSSGPATLEGGTYTYPKAGLQMTLPSDWTLAGQMDAAVGPAVDGFKVNMVPAVLGTSELPTKEQIEGTNQGIKVTSIEPLDTPVGKGQLVPYTVEEQGVKVEGTIVVVQGSTGSTGFIFSALKADQSRKLAEDAAKTLQKIS